MVVVIETFEIMASVHQPMLIFVVSIANWSAYNYTDMFSSVVYTDCQLNNL